MFEKIKRNIFISIALTTVIFLGLSIYADIEIVLNAIRRFNFIMLPLLLLLAYSNYFMRFIKWHYYLHILQIKIGLGISYLIFMSGLSMSVTPGKVGEVLKSYMIKRVNLTPVTETAPIVFVERLTDLFSLLLIGIAGAFFYGIGEIALIIISIFFILIIFVITNRKLSNRILDFLAKRKFISKYITNISLAYSNAQKMLKPYAIISMTFVSLIAWMFECLILYLILNEFNIDISLLRASFIYAFSTIIGSISMLPGGIGATEGSLTFLMMKYGTGTDVAALSTILVRLVTLWFAVFIGVICLVLFQHKYGRINNTE